MKGLAFLFSAVALALGIYSAWRVTELQRGMESFENEVRAEIVKVKIAADAGATRSELLAAAREHSQKAEQLMRRGDLEAAKRELARSIEIVERAKRPGLGSDGSAAEVRHAWESVRREATRLWQEFAKEGVKEAGKR